MEYNGYRITALDTYSMVKIQPKGSGDIPKQLEGLFTNRGFATQAIDRYLNELVTKKRKANAKKESTSTS